MRSFVCCGVSRTVCAPTGDGTTRIPSRTLMTKQYCDAPSLTGCMRILDPPKWIIQGEGRSPSGNSRTAMLPLRRRSWSRGLWNLRGGQVSHEKKQQRIRRNVQIKIHEAMHQETRRSHETGEL